MYVNMWSVYENTDMSAYTTEGIRDNVAREGRFWVEVCIITQVREGIDDKGALTSLVAVTARKRIVCKNAAFFLLADHNYKKI